GDELHAFGQRNLTRCGVPDERTRFSQPLSGAKHLTSLAEGVHLEGSCARRGVSFALQLVDACPQASQLAVPLIRHRHVDCHTIERNAPLEKSWRGVCLLESGSVVVVEGRAVALAELAATTAGTWVT